MESSKITDNKLFGLIINLIFGAIIYFYTAFFIWTHISLEGFSKIMLFVPLWILTIYILKIVISIIYLKIVTNSTSEVEEFIDDFYGENKRLQWGGHLTTTYEPHERSLVKEIKLDIISLKKVLMEPNIDENRRVLIQEDIEELNKKIDDCGNNVITGGSLFEGLFCSKKVLNKRRTFN